MSSMDDPEQRLAEALRARASQAGWASAAAPAPPPQQVAGFRPPPPAEPPAARAGGTRPAPSRSPLAQVGWALLIAFLAGAALGCAIALLSVFVPGLLPPLG